MTYKVDSWLGDGVAIISGQLWSRVKARKRAICQITGFKIEPGSLVYRPATNGDNRMHRILASSIDREER